MDISASHIPFHWPLHVKKKKKLWSDKHLQILQNKTEKKNHIETCISLFILNLSSHALLQLWKIFDCFCVKDIFFLGLRAYIEKQQTSV